MGRTMQRRRPPASGAVIFYGSSKPKQQLRLLHNAQLPPNNAATSASSITLQNMSSVVAAKGHTDNKPPSSSISLDGFAMITSVIKEVNELFSNVPYVQIVAGIALKILQIADEIRTNRDRSLELIEKIMSYSRVVFEALLRSELHSSAELCELKDDLLGIGSVLESIYEILQSFSEPTATARLNRFINRAGLLARIEEQDRRLDTSITAFQLKSSIVLRTIPQNHMVPTGDKVGPTEVAKPSRPYSSKLRSKPQIMRGRDKETESIVDAILNPAPARVAILGPGGIGKTTVALSVLHDERIRAKYGDNRLFISCEAASSVDLVISEIALSLQITTETGNHLFNAVLRQLGQLPYIIVLDNFESPWDLPHVRSDVEALLEELTALPNVAVLVTLRGSQRPSRVDWTMPLPPLHPVDLDSALAIFHAISKKTSDEYAIKLIQAVDCVPLAVTLLGNLAAVDGETSQALWSRWAAESTSMIESGQDRLTSLEYSVRLSITSPRMARDPEALSFLSLLSLLPDGMSADTFHQMCSRGLPGVSNCQKSTSSLLQNALVFIDSSKCLRILSPIRLFICAHHPPSLEGRAFLQDHFLDLVLNSEGNDVGLRIRSDVGNIEAMLVDSLHSNRRLEEVIEATLNLCHYTYVSGVGSASAIALAVKKLGELRSASTHVGPIKVKTKKPPHDQANRRFGFRHLWKRPSEPELVDPNTIPAPVADGALKLQADCLGCWGQLLSRQSNFEEAEEKFWTALELHIQAGDVAGQAYDVHNLGCLLSRQPSSTEQTELRFREAMKLHETVGDAVGMAYDLMGLGYVSLQRSIFVDARTMFMDALRLYAERGDDLGQASALNNLGHTMLAWSKFDDAEGCFSRALGFNTKMGDIISQAESLSGLACACLLRSRFADARSYIEKAISLRTEPDPDHIHILGRVLIAESRYAEANETLDRSEYLHKKNGDVLGCADDAQYLSQVYVHRGNDEALTEAEIACSLYCKMGNMLGEADSLAAMCMIQIRFGDLVSAQRFITQALELHIKVDCTLGHAYDLYQRGCIELRLGHFDVAIETFREALVLHSRIGHPQGQADDYNKLCEALLRTEQLREAVTGISQALALHIQIDDVPGQGDDLYVQGCIFLQQSRFDDAEDALRKALELHSRVESGMSYSKGRDLAMLSSVLWKRCKTEKGQRPEGVLKLLKEAKHMFRDSESFDEIEQCKAQERIILDFDG